MEKTTAALIGALAGLTTMGSAQAGIPPALGASEALQASSYTALLSPVPNAVALLKADDASRAQRRGADSLNGLQLAQDHHHHHHQQYQQYQQQSHHHHQQQQQQYRQQSHHHHHHRQQQL